MSRPLPMDYETQLKRALWATEYYENLPFPEYEARNRAVVNAIYHAMHLGMQCGFRVDPVEPEWPVAYIELPTGQVSWHLPQHVKPWDGHTNEEKYRRLFAYAGERREGKR